MDNEHFSIISYAGIIGTAAPDLYLPVQLNIFTGPLSAGEHTIEVQFYRVSGSPTLMERVLAAAEIAIT